MVDSGDEHLNQWRTHVVDLAEVFDKTFGRNLRKERLLASVCSPTPTRSVGRLPRTTTTFEH